MTDDELKALCESNARSCEANSSAIADLGRGMVQFREDSAAFREESAAFRNELRSWVQVHNQISDDQGAEVADLRTSSSLHDAQVTALRDAANADRQAFVAKADADREAFREAMEAGRAKADADRAEWQAGFQAQMEVIQRMLLEIRSTNGAVSGLSDRVDNLEQAG